MKNTTTNAAPVRFNVTKAEQRRISQIARRARCFDPSYVATQAEMDITATHRNGCPLDLDKLIRATDGDFVHDVFGIRLNLNRKTGALENLFDPRCALPVSDSSPRLRASA